MSAAIKDDPGQDPGDYRLERSVGHLLRRAHQRHTAVFLAQAGSSGLTPAQGAVLARLNELGRATQNALGRAVALDSATIQGIVQRLIARGLVCAGRDPLDRRTLVLSLTEAGAAALHEAARCALRSNEVMLEGLDEAERAQFLALLRRVAGT